MARQTKYEAKPNIQPGPLPAKYEGREGGYNKGLKGILSKKIGILLYELGGSYCVLCCNGTPPSLSPELA
jgi:hypothetical protein